MEINENLKKIEKEWLTTNNNIVINSVAGSGKTSTLLHLLGLCEHRVLFLAFNKAIQEEIQEEINKRGYVQGKAMTLHSLGLATIRNTNKKFKIDKNKKWDIVKKVQTKFKLFRKFPYTEVMRISYSLMELDDASRMTLNDDFNDLNTELVKRGISLFAVLELEEYWKSYLEFREESYNQNLIKIDFLDMIYLPVKWNLTIPIYPSYVFIDECQDLNLLQHKLFDLLVNQGTVKKWVSVGDKNQSIYEFAGASSESFELFFQKSDNVIEMSLDVCYRCATKIVDSANEVYPNYMKPHKNYSGIVEEFEGDLENLEPNSMILCRNSSPLVELYFELVSKEINCYINGEDIMGNLIRFLNPYKKDTIRAAIVEMGYEWGDLQEDTSDSAPLKRFIFEENHKNFLQVANNLYDSLTTVETMINDLQNIFSSKEGAIMLCTIHKSKGLQADTVYILNENLIPSKFAKTPEQLKQEKNLQYVARTRAKEKLYFLNM